MDTNGWVTHCFGRFLVDLPPQVQVRASYRIRGNEIERLPVGPSDIKSRVDARETELKSRKHATEPGLFVRKVEHVQGSETLLSWSLPTWTEGYTGDSYFLSASGGFIAYLYSGEIEAARLEQALMNRESLARSVRFRQQHEIPTEPGFCLDGGYIAGREYMSEQFRVGITLPDHPGMHMSFRSSTGAAESGLLDRVGGFLRTEVLGAVAGLHTLRKRRRPVGPVAGEEYLVAGSDQGQRIYAFKWEAPGRDGSLAEPNIGLELGVMEREPDDAGNPPPPAFESDEQALQLWDAILESIRLRPGAV